MIDLHPPFLGEDYLFALLLRMVQEHCSTVTAGALDSFGLEAHADAMRALGDAGYIEITEQNGPHIRATILPAAETLVARFLAARGPEPSSRESN